MIKNIHSLKQFKGTKKYLKIPLFIQCCKKDLKRIKIAQKQEK